jgi:hypothetical protein
MRQPSSRSAGPGSILTTRHLNRALLARQMLLARERRPIIGAVEHLVALQAQVARPPFVGLWTRLSGFERSDLLSALHKRTIVRGTALRGTLHVMTARDFIGLRGAMQPAMTEGLRALLKERVADLDLKALHRTTRAFFSRGPASFDALRQHIKEKDPTADERAMAYAARITLPTVQVPVAGTPWGFPTSADFALADEWLKKPIDTEDAPADALVRRYLAAFGPATVRDAQAWCFLKNLGEVFERMRKKLVTFRDEKKRELFDLPDAPRPDPDTPAPVRFIAEFDNLLLSHDDRTRIVATAHRGKVYSKNLIVPGTVLVDGMVAATWKMTRKKTSAALDVAPFAKVDRQTKAAIEAEGEALLRFLEPEASGRSVRLT